uniref:Uncharacterized protein n=1 Tax=Cacopsylla melanoneura TaxID=428564 RepID=A0A8D8TEH7_9HEMI
MVLLLQTATTATKTETTTTTDSTTMTTETTTAVSIQTSNIPLNIPTTYEYHNIFSEKIPNFTKIEARPPGSPGYQSTVPRSCYRCMCITFHIRCHIVTKSNLISISCY